MEENKSKAQKTSKFWALVKSNKVSSLLFVVMVAIGIWAFVKIYITEKSAASEISKITEIANQKMDSIKQLQIEQTATVFSWAVRSELMRQNLEQVDQFFMSFVKQPNVIKIYLVEPSTNKITLSTDKKDENTELKEIGLNANTLILRNNNNVTRAISPIMGLNEKIGILVIDFGNE